MNRQTLEIVANWRDLEKRNLNKHVFVGWARLEELALEHAKDDFQIPNWRFPGVYANRELAFAAQQIFANCFNANYNVFEKPDTKYTVENPHDASRPFTGAFAMERAIYENFGERIIQAHDFAEHVKSPKAMAKFFGGIVPMPSPELKQRCGEDFVMGLVNKFQGNPLNILEEATVYDKKLKRSVIYAFDDHFGHGLINILINMFGEAYKDTSILTLRGKDNSALYTPYLFNFNKRAQLVAVLLHGRALDLDSKGILPPVIDVNEVGPIADYELPKALRALGVFRYSYELAELVDDWKEVAKDSQMEVEIRAATVPACLKFLECINAHREHLAYHLPPINICHLDYWLWKMGKDAKHLRPHLTRTSAY